MFFLGDDLVELGVVEAVVAVLAISVCGLEVGEDLGLACDFEHWMIGNIFIIVQTVPHNKEVG